MNRAMKIRSLLRLWRKLWRKFAKIDKNQDFAPWVFRSKKLRNLGFCNLKTSHFGISN